MKVKNIITSLLLSFLVAVGGVVANGASAPAFNVNYPAFNLDGGDIVYFGGNGKAYYTVNNLSYAWDLVSTSLVDKPLDGGYWYEGQTFGDQFELLNLCVPSFDQQFLHEDLEDTAYWYKSGKLHMPSFQDVKTHPGLYDKIIGSQFNLNDDDISNKFFWARESKYYSNLGYRSGLFRRTVYDGYQIDFYGEYGNYAIPQIFIDKSKVLAFKYKEGGDGHLIPPVNFCEQEVCL